MRDDEKDKTPSKVKLTLFSLYRAVREAEGRLRTVERMVGAYEVGLTADGRVSVIAGSVPFNAKRFDVMSPQTGFGMLTLFGIRDSIDELQRWRTIARNSGAEFSYAELTVDVGEIDMGLSSRESLKALGGNCRFLNLRRTTASFQKEILATLRGYVAEEGGDPDAAMSEIKQAAYRPDLFDRLLYEDPQLKNIDVFVLPLADLPSGRVRQVAYLRSGAHILEIAQGDDQAILQLPPWMTDVQAAKRLRKQVRSSLTVGASS